MKQPSWDTRDNGNKKCSHFGLIPSLGTQTWQPNSNTFGLLSTIEPPTSASVGAPCFNHCSSDNPSKQGPMMLWSPFWFRRIFFSDAAKKGCYKAPLPLLPAPPFRRTRRTDRSRCIYLIHLQIIYEILSCRYEMLGRGYVPYRSQPRKPCPEKTSYRSRRLYSPHPATQTCPGNMSYQ